MARNSWEHGGNLLVSVSYKYMVHWELTGNVLGTRLEQAGNPLGILGIYWECWESTGNLGIHWEFTRSPLGTVAEWKLLNACDMNSPPQSDLKDLTFELSFNSAAVMKDLIAANVSDFDRMSVQVANDE